MSNGSWHERLLGGFRKTSDRLLGNLAGLSLARLDEATLDEIEEALIASDLGPATAARVRARLAEGQFERNMEELGIRLIVADEVAKALEPVAKRLEIEAFPRPQVILVIGVNGSGKTTTIAKLAARAVMRHGADQVALVSTDHYRIGAAAQLEHYGRLLGVRVYPAYDADSLRKVLEMLHGRHTVLIDTAGVAASDPRLAQQMAILADASALRACLVLAANAQAQALDAAVSAYLPLKPRACILTKLDEAPNLGGALSAVIRHRLPLDYTTDGQRVPEDIATADARVLVCRAAQSLKGQLPDDSLMAERFGLAAACA